MQFRDATPEDLPVIHSIYAHYISTSLSTLREEPLNPSEGQPYYDRLKDLRMPYLVAVDPKIIGFAYADLFNDRSGYKHTVEDTIYLHHEHCGKGVGRLLLKAVLAQLKDMEKKVVIAKMSILPGQEVRENASCKLHMGLGFREVGRLEKVGLKFGNLVDVVVLQLDLDGYRDT